MRLRNYLFCQPRDARLPSSTCANIMAALLRFGAARACRLLAAYAVRSPSIYQRNSVAFHKENILKACLPRVSASRYLNSETTASETVEETTEKFSAESVTTDRTDFPDTRHEREKQRNTLSGRSNYERNVNQLGSINIKRILLRTFENILQIGEFIMSHVRLYFVYSRLVA